MLADCELLAVVGSSHPPIESRAFCPGAVSITAAAPQASVLCVVTVRNAQKRSAVPHTSTVCD